MGLAAWGALSAGSFWFLVTRWRQLTLSSLGFGISMLAFLPIACFVGELVGWQNGTDPPPWSTTLIIWIISGGLGYARGYWLSGAGQPGLWRPPSHRTRERLPLMVASVGLALVALVFLMRGRDEAVMFAALVPPLALFGLADALPISVGRNAGWLRVAMIVWLVLLPILAIVGLMTGAIMIDST